MVQRVALWCLGVLLVGGVVCFHPLVTEAKLPRASAAEVSTVQQELTRLRFYTGPLDGQRSEALRFAVEAFQKVNGLSRDGIVGPETLGALATSSIPKANTVHDGIHTEVDIPRQVLAVYDGSQLLRILPVSSGSGKTYRAPHATEDSVANTPTGSMTFFRHIEGIHRGHLGRLWNPVYFHAGGFAVHGEPSVPVVPASHGCIRIPVGDSEWFEQTVPLGSAILVSPEALSLEPATAIDKSL